MWEGGVCGPRLVRHVRLPAKYSQQREKEMIMQ